MGKTYYSKLVKGYEKDLIKNLYNFVAINSQYDEKTVSEKNPFGEGVSKALDFIACLAKKDGFMVTNYANKVVEIIVGEGKKNITIMAHADVVPEGNGWTHDPFKVIDRKGILVGRGVADDKGPCLSAYYALKALRDHKLLGDYKVRFLVGGNEEKGSACMEYYFKTLKKEQPTLGFSPDSSFPVVYAEKNMSSFKINKKISVPGIISVKGGNVINAVIDQCEVKVEIDNGFLQYILKNFKDNEAKIVTRDDISTITFYGKSAHGSMPQCGVNAGVMALKALAGYYNSSNLKDFVEKIDSLDGSSFNGYYHDKAGDSTSNVGIISWENGCLELHMDYRYFSETALGVIRRRILKVFDREKVTFLVDPIPLYFSPKSKLITTLVKSYQEETGDLKTKPMAIGGGTYAKEANNVVAYGMEFPGFETNMHGVDEQIEKESLFKGMAIYANAIIALGKIL